jgi:two-component system, OmpR family, alkaline phosphatase synthesis response regulator PhoP
MTLSANALFSTYCNFMNLNKTSIMGQSTNCMDIHNKVIIIVEDDIPSVKYYETLLRNSGAIVRVFSNGKSFVNYFSETDDKIDLILIDFLIPLVNGIECIKLLRKSKRNVPVLMLTAYYSEQTKAEAYIAGCNEYILKPVFPEKLLGMIEKYLSPQISYAKIK